MHANTYFPFLPTAQFSLKPKDRDSKWQFMFFIVPAMTLTAAIAVASAVMIIAMFGGLIMSVFV